MYNTDNHMYTVPLTLGFGFLGGSLFTAIMLRFGFRRNQKWSRRVLGTKMTPIPKRVDEVLEI